ncbi:MAG: T9SS type A sorting domain-containing protein [Bacteroidetes bacterium]|nr:T9SS type A sorting domain-containing protein [Bacteroidota bacterium]
MKRFCYSLILCILALQSCKTDDHSVTEHTANQTKSVIETLGSESDNSNGMSDSLNGSINTNAFRKKSKKEIIDSLFNLSFDGPFTIEQQLDTSTIELFAKMARDTKGEAVFSVSKTTIEQTIDKIIEDKVVPKTDLVILIDKTASMTDDIEKVKEGLGQIIATLAKKSRVRLAVGLYGDINYMGDRWFDFEVFEYNYSNAIKFLNEIELIGNYDDPESVYEAFFEVANSSFWESNTKRMVILIGDAAPQEAPLSKYTIYDVINKAKEGNVFMNFYPVLVNPEIVLEKLSDDLVAKKIISKVYPNPTLGEINFEFLDNKDYSIEVFSSMGTNVFREKRNTWFFSKNFSNLPNGSYILRVFDKEGNFETQKFVIYK